MTRRIPLIIALFALIAAAPLAAGQQQAPPPAAAGVTPPADYVIGPEDVLIVQFWRDDQISGEAMVRPDGKITLRLLNDIQASGLTPDQLRAVLLKEADRYLEDPSVTVIVKQINSRKVMVMGEVGKTGPLPLNGPMTVLQAIGMAGGLTEYAKKNEIAVIRSEQGKPPRRIPFDYQAIAQGRKLEQNIFLMPNDTVLVP
jgi:polysaccharide export outer membrane protein